MNRSSSQGFRETYCALSSVGSVPDIPRASSINSRLPSMVRRLGMGMIQRSGVLKRLFMDEARGMSGTLPTLLKAQ